MQPSYYVPMYYLPGQQHPVPGQAIDRLPGVGSSPNQAIPRASTAESTTNAPAGLATGDSSHEAPLDRGSGITSAHVAQTERGSPQLVGPANTSQMPTASREGKASTLLSPRSSSMADQLKVSRGAAIYVFNVMREWVEEATAEVDGNPQKTKTILESIRKSLEDEIAKWEHAATEVVLTWKLKGQRRDERMCK